jgi:hypothetical protein
MHSPAFDNHFHYRSIMKLNHFERSSRPDISCAIHQCARFSSNPRKEHGEAVKRIGRYLKGTRNLGFIMTPTEDHFQVCQMTILAGIGQERKVWSIQTRHAQEQGISLLFSDVRLRGSRNCKRRSLQAPAKANTLR